jgi:hypothetical protein
MFFQIWHNWGERHKVEQQKCTYFINDRELVWERWFLLERAYNPFLSENQRNASRERTLNECRLSMTTKPEKKYKQKINRKIL